MSTISWTLLGLILNGLFLGHGIRFLSGDALNSSLGLVGAATSVYAAVSLMLLLAAWLVPVRAVVIGAALVAGVYAVLIVAAAWRLDVIRSFEWLAGITLVVAFVATNLMAIKRVQARAVADR